METKVCTMCKKELPIENFSKHKTSHNGIRSYCKACAKSYKDKWDKENEEHRKIYKKKYNQDHAEENRVYSKSYRLAHREHCLEYDRQRYQRIKEQKKEYNREYHAKHYQINKESIKASVKEYQQNNPEWLKVIQRRAKLRRNKLTAELPSTFTLQEWETCLIEFDYSCAYCGSKTRMTQEHVIPVTKGGGYESCNIVPACQSCNSSKNGSNMEAWYIKQPFYTTERLKKIHDYLASKR